MSWFLYGHETWLVAVIKGIPLFLFVYFVLFYLSNYLFYAVTVQLPFLRLSDEVGFLIANGFGMTNFVLLAVLGYAIGQGVADGRATAPAVFHPCYLVLAAGIAMAFLTGDLFNLFVAFEVMLVASYVLITLDGGKEQVRAGMTYVVVSLLASVLFVTVVGLVYAATGTVNMADAAVKLQDVPEGVRLALGLTMLVVFGVKAAIFPLFSWLPDSYPTAPSPVTAVFAGLLTKVGVYAILRTQTL
ncbi:MAG: hypothetical protein KY392_00360, partial [Chloroflexi bacterium]|nr:hypothetical protein [Chloroflexota bacterium]